MANLSRIVSTISGLNKLISSHPLAHDAPVRAWARFANFQINSRLKPEIVVPWVGGSSLALRRGMSGATGNYYVGLHEFMSMMLTVHFLRPGDLFVDAGANVGTYTVLASAVSRARTVAFEPAPEAAVHLRRNIELNSLGSLVTVETVALGSSDGEIAFTVGLDAINRVATANDANTRRVPLRTLDGMLAGEAPSMIKMDLEGHEEEAFGGAQRTLANDRLKVISIEETTDKVLAMLARAGFERAFYDPFTRVLQREPNRLAFANGEWTRSNQFYVRDWPFVVDRLATAAPVKVLHKNL